MISKISSMLHFLTDLAGEMNYIPLHRHLSRALFSHSFSHSFSSILDVYYVPMTVLGSRNKVENSPEHHQTPTLKSLCSNRTIGK